MKMTFKHIIKRSAQGLGLAAFLFLTSCETDIIDIDDRQQWLGAWTCQETSGDFAPQSYTITIYEGTQLDEVEVSGLYNQGTSFTLYANVYNDDLIIPNQTVDGFTVAGSFEINSDGDGATVDFIINDGAGGDNVGGNLSR